MRASSGEVKLLVSDERGDLVKARLPADPRHPRALLTWLEGLSLWNGHVLRVALSATDDVPGWSGSMLFGDELWPAESQLVRFDLGVRACRRARLRGVGDFGGLRSIAGGRST
jgi:hypothetical protein